MKQGKIIARIDGKKITLVRGAVARVYYSKNSSPCGADKPLRLWRLIDGKQKSSWHPLDELDALNASAKKMNESARAHGEDFAIPSRDETNALRLYREFCEARKGTGEGIPTLSKIVSLALDRERVRNDTPRISEIAGQYIEEKRYFKNLSNSHLAMLDRIFKLFIEKTGDKKLADVSITEVQKILMETGQQTNSLRAYFSNLRALFMWYYKRENASRRPIDRLANPLEALEIPPIEKNAEPEIISPETLKRYLDLVRKNKPEMLPAVVLQAFCGVRRAEALRLKWKDLRNGQVFLTGAITKTKISRSAPIPPCAAAWLALVKKRDPECFIAFPKMTKANRETKAAAAKTNFDASCGLNIPRNALRHSASTYLALDNDIGSARAAEICGHDERTAKVYYRNLSTQEVAKQWFSVLPS